MAWPFVTIAPHGEHLWRKSREVVKRRLLYADSTLEETEKICNKDEVCIYSASPCVTQKHNHNDITKIKYINKYAVSPDAK